MSTQVLRAAVVEKPTPEPSVGLPGVGVPVVGRGFLRRPVVGGVEVLSRRLRREFALNTRADEHVRFCLRGESGHALVCLDDRVLILKRGFHAGTTFGAMSATIFYRDVTGIHVRMQLLSGWIEIQSPSFQGSDRARKRRSTSLERDPYKQSNCVPIQRRHLGICQVALAELRGFVIEAKAEHGQGDVVDQLERLAELRRQGVIDDAEFAALKLRVLGGPSSSADRLLHVG